MLECLIVGGGIHGTHLANRLVTRDGLPLDKIMIIDPHDSPCQRWKELTSRTGMRFLRSPIVHHLDTDPWALQKFMNEPDVKRWASTLGVSERPSLRLFNAHIDHVVEKNSLYKAYRKGLATGIQDLGTHLVVETSIGSIATRKLVLAISSNETPNMPLWISRLVEQGAPIRNVFEPQFNHFSISSSFSYAVIGSGLTAVQLALSIAHKAPEKCTLITKGALDINDLDFDPCWIGPKCLSPFGKIADYDLRRKTLTDGRNSGTIPRPIAATLARAEARGQLEVLRSRAESGRLSKTQKIILGFADGRHLSVDRVIVAIGFEKAAPGANWLGQAGEELGLVRHTDGYPILDSCLRWHKRIYVTGALAELETGAAARNIVGARIAGNRICPTLVDSD